MNKSLPDGVRIVEVGPRDGLQNEKQPIDVAVKVRLVEMLAEAGLTTIETGSFVNPKWVPQMAGSEQVFADIERRDPHVNFLQLRNAGSGSRDCRVRHGPHKISTILIRSLLGLSIS